MPGGSWWSGTRLVAGRALGEGLSSRSWRVVTALMLVLGLAVVVVPRVIGERDVTYRLATVGPTDAGLAAPLEVAAGAGGFEVEFVAVSDAAAAEQAVREGDADVAVAGGGGGGGGGETTLYVRSDNISTFPALVSQAVLAQTTTAALAEAGLSPAQIAEIQATPPPEQVTVGRVADEGRAAVGFVVGIILYLALILTGTSISAAVALEKSTRISEVLLAVLRPTQLLVGTVLGVGVLGLTQIAAIAVPAAVGVATGTGLDLPASASGDIALGVVWFVLGLLLYAFVFAALATLVEKVTEVNTATLPVNVVLIGSYLLAVTVTVRDPNSWASVAASLVPFSAPLVMPIRWASGLVPVWQLVLAMGLVAATAVGLALLASRIYARGLTLSGRRVRLREVLTD
jgi:ABC-2 type transport system permease protein